MGRTELDPSKAVRFAAFLEELKNAEAPSSFEEAYELLCQTLNRVEDTLTTVPFDPESRQTDGRMYPPQEDSKRTVPDHENVTRFRSRAHNTFISANGAIEIQEVGSNPAKVVFAKPGANGKGVWD